MAYDCPLCFEITLFILRLKKLIVLIHHIGLASV